MQLLQIPNLAAKGEAEALCADLVKQGKVDYVMSEDTDTLAHGSPNLIQRGQKTMNLYCLVWMKFWRDLNFPMNNL